YLGLRIQETTIAPQKLFIADEPQTLRDLQQLCGMVSWVGPLLGISPESLAPLFNLLRGDDSLDSPRSVTPEAREAIGKVQKALSTRRAHQMEPGLQLRFIVMGQLPHLQGRIFQWDERIKDPLSLLEWLFLPHQLSKSLTTPQELMVQLIRKAKSRIHVLAGCDFACIYMPFKLGDMEFVLQSSECLQFALHSYSGQLSSHHLPHKLFNINFKLVPKLFRSNRPLRALMVFTNGSGASHRSVLTWRNSQTSEWEKYVEVVEGSPQIAELSAMVRAFERFQKEPINIVTDSAYVAGVVERGEQSVLKEVPNPKLYDLLSQLVFLLSHREQPYYIMHVRSHTDLPG
ncbi:POK8 protein, partial [Myiagra hebetior]|nr:POK8 protein [Myiagra hebetior]